MRQDVTNLEPLFADGGEEATMASKDALVDLEDCILTVNFDIEELGGLEESINYQLQPPRQWPRTSAPTDAGIEPKLSLSSGHCCVCRSKL